MHFIITVDTEADDQWRENRGITCRNIEYLPRFQELCERYGFIPTYFTTYEIAADPDAVKTLKPWQDNGRAEIGAHLHPWTTPPLASEKKSEHCFPSELADEVLKNKLINLTEIIEKNFGRRPTSYRAGRWGFDGRQAGLLSELGYLADSSITPKINWSKESGRSERVGGPDFRLAPLGPHRLASGLLEVPMTILFTGLIKKEKSAWSKKFLAMPGGWPKKIINRLFFRQKWLRIFANSTLRDWEQIYRSAILNGLPALVFMIHSSELMPGGSPYARDEKAVEHVYGQLEQIFGLYKKYGLKGSGLSDFARNYKN